MGKVIALAAVGTAGSLIVAIITGLLWFYGIAGLGIVLGVYAWTQLNRSHPRGMVNDTSATGNRRIERIDQWIRSHTFLAAIACSVVVGTAGGLLFRFRFSTFIGGFAVVYVAVYADESLRATNDDDRSS